MVIADQFPHLTFALGLLANIGSFMVFLSPLPTFYDVYKKKSTEGFQSIPYVVGLFTSMMSIYYALLKGDAMILITIRALGIVIQTFYLCVFVYYAPKRSKKDCLKLTMLFIVIGFGLIIQVIKTKSVEFMPILLSLSVTLSNAMWFVYGLLIGDFNILIPNTLGFTLGIIQVLFYFVYKNKKPDIDEKIKVNKEEISEIDEPRAPKVKDQSTIDIVEPKAFICSENARNLHGVVVVCNPIVANHTIEVPA
ncbi:hypothetical protein L1987_30699 [Smallanthus sonchifolius]|uniref:Uncharacterized protein n=1 Tax=Smallanthus sonchifolius TaxID=185202 RepID=A0ACB9I457_9ASTR|nr:hypothetical protein L1987_30699 [Smallanthus sonchifolius]